MSCFMTVATACRADERKFVGFFFWIWFEDRSWTLVEEGKEFAGHSIGYCFTGFVACCSVFVLVCVNGSLTLCYLYPTGGSKNRPKILARRHLLTNQICIFEPEYFLLVDFRSYFSRMFYSMFLADWLKNIKM